MAETSFPGVEPVGTRLKQRRRQPAHPLIPTYKHEAALLREGFLSIAGVDEVGRGPLAGPVVAGAVVLRPEDARRRWWRPVRDSKMLTAAQREELAGVIRDRAASFGIGAVGHDGIDRFGIVKATRQAMAIALKKLPTRPDYLLIDGRERVDGYRQQAIIDGDALVVSIAAASIVAKVYRDRLMEELDLQYPGWGFGQHKGYYTPQHIDALRRLGPSPIHRMSFAPLNQPALGLDFG